MKAKLFVATLLGLLVFSTQARAQTEYGVAFRGTAQTTDAAGNIVSHPINNTTLLQDAANGIGATNTQSLLLVYHVNAGENSGQIGDNIETINTTNGQTVYTNFSFFSGGSFGPAIYNADQTQAARLCDVFTPQSVALSGEDLGTALINERLIGKNGVVKKTIISGTVLYHVVPQGTNNETICNATFTVNKQIK